VPQSPTYYVDFCAGLTNETDMTFQVLLIGNDGVVLASDRLFRTRGLRGLTEQRRTSYQPTLGTKIYVTDDKLALCMFAGSPYSEKIARHIATTCCPSGLSDSHWRNMLEIAVKSVTDYDEQSPDEFLVVRVDNMTAVKIFRQSGDVTPPTPIEDGFMWSGRETDAIIVPKLFWRSGMTCAQLRTLAIVSITQASIEAPQLVGGGINVVVVSTDQSVENFQYSQDEAHAIREAFMARVWEGLPV
jgi:hypothetical protein